MLVTIYVDGRVPGSCSELPLHAIWANVRCLFCNRCQIAVLRVCFGTFLTFNWLLCIHYQYFYSWHEAFSYFNIFTDLFQCASLPFSQINIMSLNTSNATFHLIHATILSHHSYSPWSYNLKQSFPHVSKELAKKILYFCLSKVHPFALM